MSSSKTSVTTPTRPRMNSFDRPSTPQRPRLNSRDMSQSTPQRARLNSRDIPRSYSGLYGEAGDDLLPFELSRKQHVDWLENGGILLLCCYVGGVAIVEILSLAILETVENHPLPLYWSWTLTNAFHAFISIVYLHWMKGSLFDEQGEMAAMTLWEQLEGRFGATAAKRVLTAVPTFLCYAACQFSNYEYNVCVLNITIWALCMLAKLPFMNGVRLFGINRTTGIDDYHGKDD
eukprot:scaffold909_cov135-Cylindrotheca_fusiformis.AAC.20